MWQEILEGGRKGFPHEVKVKLKTEGFQGQLPLRKCSKSVEEEDSMTWKEKKPGAERSYPPSPTPACGHKRWQGGQWTDFGVGLSKGEG